MKAILFALFAAVIGVMAYSLLQGECRGGESFATPAACAQRLSPEACRLAFAASDRIAYEERAPFATADACQREFPQCAPHRAIKSGFVPVPAKVCVSGSAPGATGTPIYRRIGASSN